VESAPGIKNPEKLRELFRVLRGEWVCVERLLNRLALDSAD
jgi:hypothetical protein